MTAGSFYGSVGNRFGIHGPGYGIQGHRGQDFTNPAGTAVPAYEAGTVKIIQYSPYLGTVVVLKMADGMYAGYCHMKGNPPVHVGQKIPAGGIVGIVAGASDHPGSSWTGPHLHTTLSSTSTGVFAGPVTDPLPRIQNGKTVTGTNANLASWNPLDPTGALASTGSVLGWLSNGSNWVRIGTFTLGASLLAVAAIKILGATDAGQAAVGSVKTIAKGAATAAVL